MLNSLNIKNYRNLKDLKLNALGKVNLITGKNNTGKTTILEAIAIYATKGDLNLIGQLLDERGEIFKIKDANTSELDINVRTFSSLFNNRNPGFNDEDAIFIGDYLSKEHIQLNFVKYIIETQKEENGDLIRRKRFLKNDTDIDNYKIGFEVKAKDRSRFFSLDEDRIFHPIRLHPIRLQKSIIENVQFVRARNINRNTDMNGNLFDNIVLTDKEQNIIEALQIIEPLTERIAFVEDNSKERSAVIKLSNSSQSLPLQSMGDGINRILTIILALVNADNGFLLIDEFENGLHYTVQEKIWKIIFQLSKKLNIQIFATTHSEDAIKGFESVLSNSNNLYDGKLIRLDNKNGSIKQVEFDAKELKIANEQNIEIR